MPSSLPPAIRAISTSSLGAARDRVGSELKLLDEGRFAICWIIDFPMYEWNEDEKRIEFSHKPVLDAPRWS